MKLNELPVKLPGKANMKNLPQKSNGGRGREEQARVFSILDSSARICKML
jgi:hypothetical protein